MTFTLTIDCDNAAFEQTETEVARILAKLASDVSDGRLPCTDDAATLWLRDANGNRVGTAKFDR